MGGDERLADRQQPAAQLRGREHLDARADRSELGDGDALPLEVERALAGDDAIVFHLRSQATERLCRRIVEAEPHLVAGALLGEARSPRSGGKT